MRGLEKNYMKRGQETDKQTLQLYERIGLWAESLKKIIKDNIYIYIFLKKVNQNQAISSQKKNYQKIKATSS